ncbi:MAG: hypothetical protein P3W84_001330, partial [Thermodesulfobacteriaceae bacterium]|nr:hypothetical protein [Thermodesulfobacteriaceae bacterium]
ISIILLFQDLYSFLSFFIGSTLAFVNFITLKKEGQDFLYRIYQNFTATGIVSYKKERFIFIMKIYMRILATGILFYISIIRFNLSPILFILGFFLVYSQIFTVFLKRYIVKKESF